VTVPSATCSCTLTVASGGVNVPSDANVVTLGKEAPVATSECLGERLASTRVNELIQCVVRRSSFAAGSECSSLL